MNLLLKSSVLLAITLFVFGACKKSDDDEKIDITGKTDTSTLIKEDIKADVTWTSDKEYLVDGLLYVEEGATLTIQPGTVVKFKKAPTTNEPSSALIIASGAKINATGTKAEPIIFTAEADDPKTAEAELPITAVGEWAGVIILGKAPVIKKSATTLNIEGIDTTEERARFGGTDENDNSGVLKYVSIRYTGIALNGESGNEIQGLTLGGVGAGTVIDYIDIFVTGDDGIEVFGGTVNLKHIAVAFSTDDDFDFDNGYRGNAQFLFSIMDSRKDGSDNAGEWDGAGNAGDDPFSAPNVANWTAIGAGQTEGSSRILTLREWFAGSLYNSIFADAKGAALRVDDRGGDNDAYDNISTPRDGYQIKLQGLTFSNFGGYEDDDLASLVQAYSTDDTNTAPEKSAVDAALKEAANKNKYVADVIPSISRSNSNSLDVVPTAANAGDSATLPAGMDPANYRGAFEPGKEAWIKGWTTLDKQGYLK